MSIWDKITRKSKKPGVEKCSKCDKPIHKIDDWSGGGPGIQDYGEPLKSEFCIDHLIEQKPKKFNDEIKSYAKAVNEMEKRDFEMIEKAKLKNSVKNPPKKGKRF